MWRRAGFVFWLVLLSQSLFSQQVYQMQTRLDVPLSIGAAAVFGGGYAAAHNSSFPPLSEAQISALDRNKVFAPDRFATRLFSPRAAHHSDFFLFGAPLLPLALMADKNCRNEALPVSAMAAQSLLLTAGLTYTSKVLTRRTRPFAYNPDAPLSMKTKPDARFSFPSGHTSTVAVLSFFSAKVFSDCSQHTRLKPYVWAVAALLPAVTGYLRVRAGKHYLSDVLVGYALGAVSGVLVPHWHKKQQESLSAKAAPVVFNFGVRVVL